MDFCVVMFIARVQSKGKNGKNYVSVLLRESKRIGDKVVSKTIAVPTECGRRRERRVNWAI